MEHKKKVIIFLLVCAAILTLIIKPHNKVIYPMIDITRKVFNVIGGQNESSTLDRGHNTSKPINYITTNPIEAIRQDCGQLCNTSRKGSTGPFFNHVHAYINCDAIFRNPFIDRSHGLPKAPRKIPQELLKDFTMNNRLPVRQHYVDKRYLGNKAQTPVWTEQLIDSWVEKAKKGKLEGTYWSSETNALRDGLKHAPGIQNGRVLVIGSENPWLEACLLEAGAREVVTLEYGRIISEHPKVKTLVPYEFRMRYLNNTLGRFDAVATFSSVEHSGLGRYGDALNPWGDIIAIARAWCVTKEGGSLTIGVMYNHGHDYIRFNADRYYGKLRYPYLTTNWKQLYQGRGLQRVHVFTK